MAKAARPPTRLSRALEELRAALGERPFLLVVDKASMRFGYRPDVVVDWNEDLPTYVARGLACEATRVLRQKRRSPRA